MPKSKRGAGAPGDRSVAESFTSPSFSSSSVAPAETGAAASPAAPLHLRFQDVQWHLPDGQALWDRPVSVAVGPGVTGVVGANGSGKSVFLQLAMGRYQPHGGSVWRCDATFAVAQDASAGPGSTVADLAGLGPVLHALARLDAGRGTADDLVLAEGRWDLPGRWERVLSALGLKGLPPGHAAHQLSGGERMRVALAGAFLSDADLLLLDEPTNHLDRPARRWLMEALAQWSGGALIASHDRELLAGVGNILQLSPTGLQRYGGNWASYQDLRAADAAAARAALDHARTERSRGLRSLQREHDAQLRRAARGREEGRTANQAAVLLDRKKSNAEAHAGREHERQQQQRQRLDDAVRQAAARVLPQVVPTLVLPQSRVPAGKLVLAFEGVQVPHAPPCQPRLDGTWSGPLRIAVTGPNGCGKSSLLRLIASPDGLAAGCARRPVRAAWLDQHHAALQSSRHGVLEHLQSLHSPLPEAVLRTHLAQLGLGADRVQRPACGLSGGERMKAALACALWSGEPAQMLLLDEPTNHLDVDATQALQSALQAFTGAVIVVSHDMAFLQAVRPDRVWAWRPAGWDLDASLGDV